MNRWKLMPVEPTYQMSEAMGVKWEQGDGFPARWKAALAAAPTPPAQEVVAHGETSTEFDDHKTEKVSDKAPAQEDEPVAWLIPRIMKMPGNPEIDGTVAWEACVFCDTRVHPRVDKNGSEFYPKPLYTRPDDKLRKAAEEVLKEIDLDNGAKTSDSQKAVENLRAALEQK